MDCSVIICTRNRADQLPELLQSLTRLHVPEGTGWELIVVDNGSTDATAQVIESFAGRLPVRRVFQPLPGLSNARNAGIDAAKGAYIVWTDDDVQVDPGWLEGFLKAFRRWPEAAVFGGKVVPLLLPPTPAWFEEARGSLSDLLCLRDFGDEPVALGGKPRIMPYGACFAVRAAEQKQFRYDPELGVAPGRRTGGEETSVIDAILASGKGGWWIPWPIVRHIIPPARQTVRYIKEYYSASGETCMHVVLNRRKTPFALGAPPIVWLKFVFRLLQSSFTRPLRLGNWARHLSSYAYFRGALMYCLSHRQPPSN